MNQSGVICRIYTATHSYSVTEYPAHLAAASRLPVILQFLLVYGLFFRISAFHSYHLPFHSTSTSPQTPGPARSNTAMWSQIYKILATSTCYSMKQLISIRRRYL